MNNLLDFISPRLEPEEVLKELTFIPPVPDVDEKTKSERLSLLQTIYQLFVPTKMVIETYYKLYEALVRAFQKKQLDFISKQHVENYKGITGKEFCGVIGGADSISIIGQSGTGKTASISRIASLLTKQDVIEFVKPYKATIVPLLIVNCPFDCSVKTLMVEIMRLVDAKIGTNYYAGTVKATATTGMLIASASNILLNHVGVLVIDEIQNVIKSKNGFNLIGALTQLVNSCGVSIVMVANPEVKPFFEQDLKLARRAIGLEFKPMGYDGEFTKLVRTLFKFQYTLNKVKLSEELLQMIYEGTNGIPALIVSLIHDAQEKAIIDGSEAINISTLESVLSDRYGIILPSTKKSIRKPIRRQSDHISSTNTTSNEVIDDEFFENAIRYAKKNNIDIVKHLQSQIEVIEL